MEMPRSYVIGRGWTEADPFILPARWFQTSVRPRAPPSDVRGEPPYERSLVDMDLCHCDRHSWNEHVARAKHLKEKERAYREAMIAVAAERTMLENEVIAHPCADSREFLSSLYKQDFSKRAFPVADYRIMKKDHDDPTVTPVAMLKDAAKEAKLREHPIEFKVHALKEEHIHGPRPIDFSSSTQPPITETNPYMSEYTERISKEAVMSLMKTKHFLQP